MAPSIRWRQFERMYAQKLLADSFQARDTWSESMLRRHDVLHLTWLPSRQFAAVAAHL